MTGIVHILKKGKKNKSSYLHLHGNPHAPVAQWCAVVQGKEGGCLSPSQMIKPCLCDYCHCVSVILFFKICEVRNCTLLVDGEEVEITFFFPSPLTWLYS